MRPTSGFFNTPGVRFSKLFVRPSAVTPVRTCIIRNRTGEGTAVRVVRQAPTDPFYPSSNEGAPLTSGVALKNPSGAQ